MWALGSRAFNHEWVILCGFERLRGRMGGQVYNDRLSAHCRLPYINTRQLKLQSRFLLSINAFWISLLDKV